MLLGPRRVVAIERRAEGGTRARLRCFCGTDVWSTDEAPTDDARRATGAGVVAGPGALAEAVSCRW